jgi:hypothetical protein
MMATRRIKSCARLNIDGVGCRLSAIGQTDGDQPAARGVSLNARNNNNELGAAKCSPQADEWGGKIVKTHRAVQTGDSIHRQQLAPMAFRLHAWYP